MRVRIIPIAVTASLLLAACGDDDAAAPSTTAVVPATSGAVTTVVPPSSQVPATTLAPAEPLPTVVVTYSVLASVVEPLLEGVATVEVIIPNGQDPHDFAPSAKEVETMSSAAMVIANGLALEEGLDDVLDRLEGEGTPVFRVTDHVTLLELGQKDDDGHDHGDEHGDEHGSGDPHVWTDPLAFAEMLPELANQLGTVLDTDLGAAASAVISDLEALDAEVRAIMQTVPQCTLVTGHDSMQYFARRFGCEVVGAVIPSLSTGAEASAGELADLRRVAQDAGVKAIFTELGTPAKVAEQVADEVGVPLVELSTHVVPDGGGYAEFVLDLATAIAEALA